MRTALFLSAVVLFAITGCTKRNSSGGNSEASLRIENSTTITFDSVVVMNPAGKQVYYAVAAGTKSSYKAFAFIYNYAYIKAYFGNQSAVAQPTDYVGEAKITEGHYTYRLSFSSGSGPGQSYLAIENHRN